MIKQFKMFKMVLTLHGVAKPYYVDATVSIDFAFDANLLAYIESIDFISGTIIDRYNDAWQFPIMPDANNSLYMDLIAQIVQAIEEKEAENLINEWLVNITDEYFKNEGSLQ